MREFEYRRIQRVVLILVGIFCLAPVEAVAVEKKKLVLSGSSTVAPLASEIAKAYETNHRGIRVDLQTGGSSRGIADARSGMVDIGMSSRDLKPSEGDITGHTIAIDGFAPIVHASNPIANISKSQLRDILVGKIKNWKKIGGKDGRIVVVNRAEGRSEASLLTEFLGIRMSDIKADMVVGENAHGIKTISRNINALTYMSIGHTLGEASYGTPVRIPDFDGIAATPENVRNGRFPLRRPLILVTKGTPGSAAKMFIRFAQSAKVSKIVESQNFIPSRVDKTVAFVLKAEALFIAAIVLLILGFLITEAWGFSVAGGWSNFLVDDRWNPTEAQFNLLPIVAGSLLVTLGAVAGSLPIGFFCAVFLHLYSNRFLGAVLRKTLEVLAGLPSVVFGFWGLVVLVPLVNAWHPPGAGLFSASVILGLMILPTAALMIDASFQLVPRSSANAVVAMGLGRWEMLTLCYLPQAKLGILTATLLSVGRAIGETMAVLMVCGNIIQFPGSIFDPVRTLTANIALELGYAEGNHRSALFVSGLVLMLLVAVLIVAISVLERRARDD